MADRIDLTNFKNAIYLKFRNGWDHNFDRDDFAEYESEIKHFENWLESNPGTVGYGCGEIHDYAVEVGILDNMVLAERLYQIEKSIESLKHPRYD
jgi:hypothetical protein